MTNIDERLSNAILWLERNGDAISSLFSEIKELQNNNSVTHDNVNNIFIFGSAFR